MRSVSKYKYSNSIHLFLYRKPFFLVLRPDICYTEKKPVPVQMSRTFFRQKSVLEGKREDRGGNSTGPTGKDIDSPEQKKTVPDFFMPSRTYRSQRMDESMSECQRINGTPNSRRLSPGLQMTME